jgi:hypothetical protein
VLVSSHSFQLLTALHITTDKFWNVYPQYALRHMLPARKQLQQLRVLHLAMSVVALLRGA